VPKCEHKTLPSLIRDIIVDAIKKDAVGPYQKDEIFPGSMRPQSKYFSGVLYPIQTPMKDEDIENPTAPTSSNEDVVDSDKIPINVGTKPSSLGLTCHVPLNQKSILVKISYGRYFGVVKKDEILGKDDKKNTESTKTTTKQEQKDDVKDDDTSGGTKYDFWERKNYEESKEIFLEGEEPGRIRIDQDFYLRYFFKRHVNDGYLTLSVFLTNEKKIEIGKFIEDINCIFQPEIKLVSSDGSKIFMNISRITENKIQNVDLDEKINLFLFRKKKHFAQGHNCSVKWNLNESEESTDWIQTTYVPEFTIPQIKPVEPTPEIKKSLNMRFLSEIKIYSQYATILQPIFDGYKEWIDNLEKTRETWIQTKGAPNEAKEMRFVTMRDDVPKNQIQMCKDALARIQGGISLVSKDPDIGEAFRFANEVMLEHISHSEWAKKNREKLKRGEAINQNSPNENPEWRLFQLAFLLLNIESISDPTSKYRDVADLLWFPTGGGKTEAYYGIIAFTTGLRRLKNKDAKNLEEQLDRYGITVIMRYTYRLLTLQQFQRASTLMCACEYVRLKNDENRKKFGDQPFLVGLWVGHDTTPNSFEEAKEKIDKIRLLEKSGKGILENATNPVQLLNCPWCGRKLTAENYLYEYDYNDPAKLQPRRIKVKCHKNCFFGIPNDEERVIPIVLIDDDIRNLRPALLLSTVDKFAQISWNWRYSTLFGNVSQYCQEHGYRPGNVSNQNKQGDRCSHERSPIHFTNGQKVPLKVVEIHRKLAPPELIIQDELHLIAGPLGTLTGLYETAVDIMCTREIKDKTTGEIIKTKPKIIASTATTKRSDVQMKNLFNSTQTRVFPPQGFDFGESYFAQVIPVSENSPGKLHLGICATSIGGYAVDSRISACILRKIRHIRENKNNYNFYGEILSFTDDEIDPYYTLVGYYNTIKNLGAAVRMYEDTIPDYMDIIRKTTEEMFDTVNVAPKEERRNLEKDELTGRISPSQIPIILDKIETKLGEGEILDALLCTNMLSVGVDVSRLGIMVINGQPKSTSEYIQASGRIGRSESKRKPGLVITNYTYIKPRDLSHFENFIQFHSTYHKSVEAGTLTPFSSRARDRGLFGVFVALVRLNNSLLSEDPKKFDRADTRVTTICQEIKTKILDRIEKIDRSEVEQSDEQIANFIKKWYVAVEQFRKWGQGSKTPNLTYRKNPIYQKNDEGTFYLLNSTRDNYDENLFVIPESLREAESEIPLYYSSQFSEEDE